MSRCQPRTGRTTSNLFRSTSSLRRKQKRSFLTRFAAHSQQASKAGQWRQTRDAIIEAVRRVSSSTFENVTHTTPSLAHPPTSTAPPSAEEIQHQELDLTDTQVQHTTKTIDLFLLHRQAQFYYDNSLAINTRSTYSAGQLRFQSFCQLIKATCMPTTETTLILFVTYLASERITYATIKLYLAAIRNTHVSAG